jgi:prepilin-type N-terminal cleavage/methylation domain-containing protein
MIYCNRWSFSPRPRFGFSLVELLVVMWLMGTLFLLGGATLLGAIRLEQTADAAHERVMVRSLLADQFRQDVGQAVKAPETLEELRSGPSCLILARPGGRYVVYRWHDDGLERGEGVSEEDLFWRPVGLGKTSAELTVDFARSGPEARLITLRIREVRGRDIRPRDMIIVAALGGDLQ